MSIKLKLSALISSVVVLILALNLLVFSLYSTGQQEKAVEQQIRTAADQIRFSMTPTLRTAYYLDAAVSERMRVASIAAIGLLGPRLADVSQATLLESAAKLNLSSLSLVQREYGGKITIKASSDSDLQARRSAPAASTARSSATWSAADTRMSTGERASRITGATRSSIPRAATSPS